MPKFQRLVQPGRVANVQIGPHKGKLATIVEIIDQNRVLVDGPNTGVPRMPMRLKRLHLTGIHLPMHHGSRTRTVRKAWKENDADKLWSETTWAKKIERKRLRSNMTDFDRFKLMKAKQMRNRHLNAQFGKLRKVAKQNKPAKKGGKK